MEKVLRHAGLASLTLTRSLGVFSLAWLPLRPWPWCWMPAVAPFSDTCPVDAQVVR